jgi:hypothetical protein
MAAASTNPQTSPFAPQVMGNPNTPGQPLPGGMDYPIVDPATGQMSGGVAGNAGNIAPVPAATSPYAGQINNLFAQYGQTATPDQLAYDENYLAADPSRSINDIQAWGTAPGGQFASATPPAGTTPGTTATAPGIKTTQGLNNDPNASAFFNRLLGEANQSLDVNPNDPVIAAQTDAYAADQTRAARDLMSQTSEAGGQFANPEAVQRSAAEKAGQNTAAFSANLMSQERAARRSDIQNALSMGGSFLTSEQQLQLQEELHQMDLQEQAYQFDTTQAASQSPFASTAAV